MVVALPMHPKGRGQATGVNLRQRFATNAQYEHDHEFTRLNGNGAAARPDKPTGPDALARKCDIESAAGRATCGSGTTSPVGRLEGT